MGVCSQFCCHYQICALTSGNQFMYLLDMVNILISNWHVVTIFLNIIWLVWLCSSPVRREALPVRYALEANEWASVTCHIQVCCLRINSIACKSSQPHRFTCSASAFHQSSLIGVWSLAARGCLWADRIPHRQGTNVSHDIGYEFHSMVMTIFWRIHWPETLPRPLLGSSKCFLNHQSVLAFLL